MLSLEKGKHKVYVPLIRYTIEPKTEEKPELEGKWLIAIVIIVIIIVGGLGWYYFFGTSSPPSTPKPMLHVDGRPYNSTLISWNLNATPSATFYSLHNASNPTVGNATTNALFSYTASFYNVSSSQWTQIYNGTKWLINTAPLLVGTIPPFSILANKTNEKSSYSVYINYTDRQINIKLQYLGNQSTVDGQTVFAYLGFSNTTSGLDTSNRAFNFTNNPNRAYANVLQEYAPANTTTWNTTATNTYSWNGTTLPSNAPVSVTITTDRKNVTWTIPYGAIDASYGKTIGVVIQAFSYNFYPKGTTWNTPPTPQNYYALKLLLPGTPFTVSMVSTSGTVPSTPFTLWANQTETGDKSTYAVSVNYTDQVINIKLQYLGDQPAVDGKTVFACLGFDGNANGILDPSERAFNFTNNPNRAYANVLQEYAPANTTTWNTTATNTYSWNGTTLPSNAPVSVTITTDRKNVTWTIPYGAIDATKDSYVGVMIQAFSYDFYPKGASQTHPQPIPSKYYQLTCLLPQITTFGFTVQPATTVRFYLKVTFSASAIAGIKYTFSFNATSPS